MFNLFGWLERRTTEAMARGAAKFAAAISPPDVEPPVTTDEIQAMIANAAQHRALEAAKKVVKSAEEEADAEAAEAVPVNGSGRKGQKGGRS